MPSGSTSARSCWPRPTLVTTYSNIFDLAGGSRHPRPGDRRTCGHAGGHCVGREGSAIGLRYRHTTPEMEARVVAAIEQRLATPFSDGGPDGGASRNC
jgi:hypothetical protein